jgi:hypothetical protein
MKGENMAPQLNDRVSVPVRYADAGGVVHVRFAVSDFDISMPGLELGSTSSDDEVKQALAIYLDVPSYRLDEYAIDRHQNGNLTLRLETIFECEVRSN